MFDFITSLFSDPNLGDWVAAVTGVVTAATAVTAITPTKVDDAALNVVLKVLNFLAGNFAKNKNADDR
jgi:predicted porin